MTTEAGGRRAVALVLAGAPPTCVFNRLGHCLAAVCVCYQPLRHGGSALHMPGSHCGHGPHECMRKGSRVLCLCGVRCWRWQLEELPCKVLPLHCNSGRAVKFCCPYCAWTCVAAYTGQILTDMLCAHDAVSGILVTALRDFKESYFS
jgi:hypothetical protein